MPATANDTRDKVRQLQNTLYLAAKRSPNRRFHALYDEVHRIDVLKRAWQQVKANQGSPGVDAQTLGAIEAGGVEAFLAAVQVELREGRYRPQAVRRVWIPKRGKARKATARRRFRQGPRGPDGGETGAGSHLRGRLCAMRRCVTVGGERPLQASVAAGAVKLGAAEIWRCGSRREQPRRRSGGAVLPDAPATPARRKGIAQANECPMPRDSKTAPNLADMGRRSSGAVSVYGCSSFAPCSWSGTKDRAEACGVRAVKLSG
jgi:hypothetical protein